MAKIMKFNLICGGKKIRKIEELQENFVIEDVLEVYWNGSLVRWLKAWKYTEELEAVQNIGLCFDEVEVIKVLVRTFDVGSKKPAVLRTVREMELFKGKTDEEIEEYRRENNRRRYNKVLECIRRNSDNIILIDRAVNTIAEEYLDIFEEDCGNVISEFSSISQIAVMLFARNEKTKQYIFEEEKIIKEISDMIEEYDYIEYVNRKIEEFEDVDYSNIRERTKSRLWRDNVFTFSYVLLEKISINLSELPK